MNAITSISRFVPSLHIDEPRNMLNKATMVAIPAITMAGLSMVRQVAADAYTDCINACDRNGRDAHPLATFVCYVLCHFFAK